MHLPNYHLSKIELLFGWESNYDGMIERAERIELQISLLKMLEKSIIRSFGIQSLFSLCLEVINSFSNPNLFLKPFPKSTISFLYYYKQVLFHSISFFHHVQGLFSVETKKLYGCKSDEAGNNVKS